MIDQLNPTIVGLEKGLTKRAPCSIRLLEKAGSRSARASVNKLPVELLAYIFEGCVERETRQLSPQPFRSYLYGVPAGSPPILFLQICRHWREVALSTSSLWTSLSGRQIYRGYSSRPSPTIPAMKYWLDRSGRAPLNLQIYFSRNSNAKPSHASDMLHLFATEISRWRSFSIEFDAALVETMMEILDRSRGKLNTLEELEVCFQYRLAAVEPAVTVLSSLLSLRSLKRLYLNYSLNFPTFDFQLIPWRQLNEILVQAPLSPDQCIHYLSQCSSASRISLYAPPSHSDSVPLSPHIPITTLPNLSSLTLTQWWDAAKVLQFLNLPSLRYLKLRTKGFHGSNRQPSIFKRFLKRSHCAIDQLSIIDEDIGISAVLEYFKIPALHIIPRVEFSFEEAGMAMLEVLQAHPNAQHLFPRLDAWDCPLTERCYIGWGDTNEEMIPKYKWEDGKIMFFST
ncbi:hypothetical protein M413DRAFT_29285 [Hebeloma cylindrosporum]|uniref:Uncharacterized protein n=1 Tax=Hebeloma cylindrosporum TaxID=76867 RepID=A0A0C3BSB4_HEBCY|nr:hypothetical protein M413DRAFT_29285 [Hebeloma cylindrosporum h7]